MIAFTHSFLHGTPDEVRARQLRATTAKRERRANNWWERYRRDEPSMTPYQRVRKLQAKWTSDLRAGKTEDRFAEWTKSVGEAWAGEWKDLPRDKRPGSLDIQVQVARELAGPEFAWALLVLGGHLPQNPFELTSSSTEIFR